MFKFYKNVYIDEALQDADGVRKKLEGGLSVLGVFLICVKTGGNGLADIFQSDQLFNRFERGAARTVIGMASGKDGAFKLMAKIASDYETSNGDWNNFKKNFH
ncbi:MAG: hypothetical protein LBL35_04055 [Clostridiales bacterium]|nr:hypothetical protein [Clostridiales bacterium]